MYIIGDLFGNVSDNKNFITYSNYIKNRQRIFDQDIRLGQGLKIEEINYLNETLLPHKINFVSKEKVHKRKESNIQLYDLNRVNENFYNSKCYFIKGNDLIDDHITGSHIPGMAIVESARQLVLAYIENEYPKSNFSFILNMIESKFNGYIFPIGIDMEIEADIKINGTSSEIISSINVIQNDIDKCNIKISGTIMDKNLFSVTEKMAINNIR